MAGLGREEEVAGRVAGLGALSLTDSHSDAPLVLVPSEGVGAVGKVTKTSDLHRTGASSYSPLPCFLLSFYKQAQRSKQHPLCVWKQKTTLSAGKQITKVIQISL